MLLSHKEKSRGETESENVMARRWREGFGGWETKREGECVNEKEVFVATQIIQWKHLKNIKDRIQFDRNCFNFANQ